MIALFRDPLFIIQIITIIFMFGMTYIIYKFFGPPVRQGLKYSSEDKEKWDSFIKNHRLGKVMTVFSVVGTLTSLAGAYVFLMGSSKLFGYFILVVSITLIPGAYITRFFSKRILASPRLKKLLESPKQTGGVIAALFWKEDASSQWTARLVKWVSIFNLVAIIWIEFSVFVAIGVFLLGVNSTLVAPLLLFGCCFTIILFTLKYGVRGFVFADLFHVPLIMLSILAIFGGSIWLSYQNWSSLPPIETILTPQLAILGCILFVIHNIFLNGLQLLTTEGHWLRVWIFREQEIKKLPISTIITGIMWGGLSIVGLLAFYISGETNVGIPVVSGLLNNLSEISLLFIALFWIGGVASLFSTSDAQLYALLTVWNFDSKKGVLRDQAMTKIRPLLGATISAAGITLLYVILLQVLQLEFEKLLFLIFGLPLILFPAFVRAYRNLPQRPWHIILALILYLICTIAGLQQPSLGFEWTLVATLTPIAVAAISIFEKRPAK